MKLAILQNEFDDNHLYWEKSCKSKGISYEIINMVNSRWLETIISNYFDGFLACPPGREALYKQRYDEQISIIQNVLNKTVYPSYDEIIIHENKKYLSYWLAANKLPHPKSYVFYSKEEAISFIQKCSLPIVSKFNIGASGKGVNIFRDREKLRNYVNAAFKTGIRQDWGPNLKMGLLPQRMLRIIKDPKILRTRLAVYHKIFNEFQKGYIILQEYIPHDYEWRVVKIGKSYFGHQKVKLGDKASGTKGINYVYPPDVLLDFVDSICSKYQFNSMAIDLFEDKDTGYLINEMQCIFGHIQEYICEKDGSPGRFIKIGNEWSFQNGLFNTNLSYDLRMDNFLEILKVSDESSVYL